MSAVPVAREAVVGLAGGYLADLVLGDPARLHPVAGFGWLAGRAETVLYAPSRFRGAAFTGLLVGFAALAAELAARLADHLADHLAPRLAPRLADHLAPRLAARLAAGVAARVANHRAATRLFRTRRAGLGRSAVLGLVTWSGLGGRSLTRVAGRLADQLDAGDLDAARATLPSLCGRDPQLLAAGELTRAGVESVAENTSDAVVGALLWGALAGPAGVAAYRAANTLDAMIGHRTARYGEFGWAAARLDDLLSLPASRASALLASVCAPLVGGSPRAAWETVRRDGAKHPSPNAGRVEAAFAGALDLRVGGRVTYAGIPDLRPVIGTGREPTTADLRRANRLSIAVGAAGAACAAVLRALVGARAAVDPGERRDGRGRATHAS
ncbi:MAG TPA: CobD/CbiB family cobalamin biosynthesis protein [Solirubrobacteraceae bacterium]